MTDPPDTLAEDRLLWEFWLNHGTDKAALARKFRDLPETANGPYLASNSLYGGFERGLNSLAEGERGAVPVASDIPDALRLIRPARVRPVTPLTPEGRLLVLLAARPAPESPMAEEALAVARRVTSWPSLVLAACRSNFVPTVARQVSGGILDRVIPEEEGRFLLKAAAGIAGRNRRLFGILGRILDRFAEAGLSPVLLKESALLLDAYPGEGDRAIGDFDLLFSGREVDAAEELLLEMGYESFEGIWSRAWYREHHHHMAPLVSSSEGIKIEPHMGIWIPRSDSDAIIPEFLAGAAPHPRLRAGRPRDTHILFHLLIDVHGNVSIGKLGQVADMAALTAREGARFEIGALAEMARRAGCLPFIQDSLALVVRLYGREFVEERIGEPGVVLSGHRPTAERRILSRLAFRNLCGFEPTAGLLSVAGVRLLHKACIRPGTQTERLRFLFSELAGAGKDDAGVGHVTRKARASRAKQILRIATFPFRAVGRALRRGRG